MRSAANSDVKMAKAPPVESPIQAYPVLDITREMQGIVGQASDFVEVVSKIDWTLLHEIWWKEIEKIKGDWPATLWYGFFFCVNTSAHARVRLSYEFRLKVFVRYARWRACQDSFSCWTRLADEKEGERWRNLQPFAASTELECERQE